MTTSPVALSPQSTPDNDSAYRRLVSVGFLADFMLYLVYTAIPFKALSLGAGPFELGLLAATSTGTYALLARVFGHIADRYNRTTLARAGCLVLCVACLSLTLAPSVGWMVALMPLVGGAMAPFWPSVQSSLADRSPLSRLSHNLGSFNLAWSTGKACGFFVGGFLVGTFGASTTLTWACLVSFTVFFVLPRDARTTATHDATDNANAAPADDTTPPQLEFDPRAPVFRSMAWIANGTAFGLGAALNHHTPRLLLESGWSPRVFGVFLGGVFLVQSLSFLVLRRRPSWWRFQRSRLYGAQALMIVAVLALPFADLPRILLCAVLFGLGLGTCYQSSIYYSLHAGAARGRNAGVHESLVGVGSMLIPFLGGWAAQATGLLAAPYMVAGGMVGCALLLQEIVFQKGRPPDTP